MKTRRKLNILSFSLQKKQYQFLNSIHRQGKAKLAGVQVEEDFEFITSPQHQGNNFDFTVSCLHKILSHEFLLLSSTL